MYWWRISIPLRRISSLAKGIAAKRGIIDGEFQTARGMFLRQPAVGRWIELITPREFVRGGGEGCFPLSAPGPGVAFGRRRIAWLLRSDRLLYELVEQGEPLLSAAALASGRDPETA